jgi:hypothetical protein
VCIRYILYVLISVKFIDVVFCGVKSLSVNRLLSALVCIIKSLSVNRLLSALVCVKYNVKLVKKSIRK